MPIIFFDWAHQLMYVHDQLLIVISSSGMLVLLGTGSGPSKLWEKLWCYDGFYSDSWGRSSSIDHCQTFSVSMIRLAKKPVLKAKLLY
jgi:hypothetical protein